MAKRLPEIVALAATLGAFLLRVHDLDFQSFWRDEMDAVLFASRSPSDLARMYVSVGDNGPLYFTVLHVWLLTAGTSDFAARFLSVIAGVATIPVLYVLGARLVSRWTGALAALLLAGAPYHIWYSQEAKMYSLVALVATLSVLLLHRAIHASSWGPWFFWLLLVSTGFYLHYFMALLIVAEAFAIVWAWRAGFPGARRGGAVLAALTIPFLPLAVWEIPLLLRGQATSYDPFSPGSLISILLDKFSVGMEHSTAWSTLLFAFLFVAGLALPGEADAREGRLLLIGWFALPLALYLIVSLRITVFLDRYLIIILPAFVLVLGRGLSAVAQRSVVVTTVASLGIAVLWLPGVWTPTPLKQDFKRSVAYLEQHYSREDTLVFVPAWERGYFDYYHPPPYTALDIPPVDSVGLGPVIDEATRALDHPTGTLWLVSVEPVYGDRDLQLQRWLDQNADLIEDVPFANLDLRHYRKRALP